MAALERAFDGPVPPGLRAVAEAGGVAAADRRAALAEARLFERQAGEAVQAIARHRARLKRQVPPEADAELPRLVAALTRGRWLAVARLVAAGRPF